MPSAAADLRFPLPYGDWGTDHHDVIYQYPGGLEGWLISIKHTAGYRDVKEQFYGSKGMLETSRSYMKLHGMTPDVRYKSADDLRDTSLMEKEESNSDITGEATTAFFKGVLAGEALRHDARPSVRKHANRDPGPHGDRDQARSHLGRDDALGLIKLHRNDGYRFPQL